MVESRLVIRRSDPGRGILALDRRWFEHAGMVWVVEHPCESGRAYRRWEVRLGMGDDPAQDRGTAGALVSMVGTRGNSRFLSCFELALFWQACS